MSATAVTAWVDGIGLLGPGLDHWAEAIEVLRGAQPLRPDRTRVPAPSALPAAERRRAGVAVKAALAVGQQALEAAEVAAADLATVFTSSGGDGVNCHEICATLATADRAVSPTRFHNSVHNAPSGYWSISSGAMATSSVLCAHDGSFGAGLLEAMAQCAAEQRAVMLVAYDTDYPQPLFGVRPIPDTFGVALLLSPVAGPRSLGRLVLPADALGSEASPQVLEDVALENLRLAIPAARSLPLLRAVARAEAGTVVMDYLRGLPLAVEVTPC